MEQNQHTHHHDEAEMKLIVDRLSRAIGHLTAVKRMVEENQDCSEVLTQLAAVKSAVNNIGREILKQHISHCVVEALEQGDHDVIVGLNSAIDKFMK